MVRQIRIDEPTAERWEIKLALLYSDLLRSGEILTAIYLWNVNDCRPGLAKWYNVERIAQAINETVATVEAYLDRLQYQGLLRRVTRDSGQPWIELIDPEVAYQEDAILHDGPFDGSRIRKPDEMDAWPESQLLKVTRAELERWQAFSPDADAVDVCDSSEIVARYKRRGVRHFYFERLEG